MDADVVFACAPTPLAVDAQGIYFYYDRKKQWPILNGVNIAVPQGAIYSLLGPSGCGKTTLLKCIVGQHKLQEGTLKVYGRAPGSKGFFIPGRGVGYMPQDLALYEEMTIEEILRYFGSLFGMNVQKINKRIDFLIDLLALPEKTRFIQHLSGGQQRRVSFAVALIHKPPLLILDEPTVGVDPVLRQTIWDHLVSLAKNEHLTIIITTHYTEEARQAFTVGLMRNGQLLVERNPENLIRQFGVVTLEEVFLRICQNSRNEDARHDPDSGVLTSVESLVQKSLPTSGAVLQKREAGEAHSGSKKIVNTCDGFLCERVNGHDNKTALLSSPSSPEANVPFRSNTHYTESWKRLWCLTRKNFLRLKRNIFFLIFMIFVPTTEIVIFFLCFGNNPFDLQVAVVNLDTGLNGFSRNFLTSIDNRTIRQKEFDNLTLAYESVKNGKSWAALYLGPEFSDCFIDRILDGVQASNDTVRCSAIKVHLDRSNYIIATTIRFTLFSSFLRFSTDLLRNYGKNPLLAESPLEFEDVEGDNSPPASYALFLTPALLVGVAYITSIALTEMTVLMEKKKGLLGRTLVAGATTGEVLMSFFLALLAMMIIQLLLMVIFAIFIFSTRCNGPFFWLMTGVLFVGIAGMAYGFLISSLTDDENAAAIIAFGSFFPIILLNGMLWPLQAMPYYLRYFCYCLPLTLIIDSLRNIVIRGWDIGENNIWDGYIVCGAWIIGTMILSVIFLKIRS